MFGLFSPALCLLGTIVYLGHCNVAEGYKVIKAADRVVLPLNVKAKVIDPKYYSKRPSNSAVERLFVLQKRVPALLGFLDLKKTALHKICVSGTVGSPLLT